MKEKIYEILKLVLCTLIFFCIGDISKVLLKVFSIDISNISNKGVVIYQFVISFIVLCSLVIVYYKSIKKDYKEFKTQLNNNITYIIKSFFLFMIVKYGVSFLSTLIMILLKYDTTSMTSVNQNLIEAYVKSSPLLMFFSTSIFAPFYEEVLFRLGIGKVIKNKYLFIIISGFVFGVMHVFPLEEGISLTIGIIQSISYVTMGLFLAYVYNKKNNIFITIGIHFLNNLLSILTMINMI